MKRKVFLLLLVVCIIGTSLFAGGKQETARQSDKMELTFFFPVNVGGAVTKFVDKICNDWNELHPEAIVKPVYTGNYDDTIVKIQSAIQGKNPPDLFISLATQRFSMFVQDAVIFLDDFIAADGAEGQAYIDDFLTGFMEDSYVEGNIISIPFQRSTMILFYNKDAFREVGLDPNSPPKTWDELVEYSQKLTKVGPDGNVQRYGVGLALNSGSAQWGFTGFALQNSEHGENLMSEDGKQIYFDTPGNVEALQFWYDLQNKYKVMQPGIVQWTDLPGQFLSGKVAMIYHTTGNLGVVSEDANFEFGTAFLPGNKRQAAPTGGGNFYISKGISPERQKMAWEFIKFATSTERAAQWSIDTGYVATRKSALETPQMKEYYAKLPQARVAFDQIPISKPELTSYDSTRMWRILNDSIQSAITGEKTPAQALRDAQAEADQVMRKYQ
ncbi:MAG: ABC transporter substrate-binding protein [Sphaerochaeta sp.]|jgi:sn-glycerol 3-phosphate transport system substrate-binding protein